MKNTSVRQLFIKAGLVFAFCILVAVLLPTSIALIVVGIAYTIVWLPPSVFMGFTWAALTQRKVEKNHHDWSRRIALGVVSYVLNHLIKNDLDHFTLPIAVTGANNPKGDGVVAVWIRVVRDVDGEVRFAVGRNPHVYWGAPDFEMLVEILSELEMKYSTESGTYVTDLPLIPENVPSGSFYGQVQSLVPLPVFRTNALEDPSSVRERELAVA